MKNINYFPNGLSRIFVLLVLLLAVSSAVLALTILNREVETLHTSVKTVSIVVVPDSSSRITTTFETVSEKSEFVKENKLVFSHLCKGEIDEVVPAVGGSFSEFSSIPFCIGENELVVTDATGKQTLINSSISKSINDAPLLENITWVPINEGGKNPTGTILIEYGVVPCTLSEDSCGVGSTQNNVAFALDIATKTARVLENYPEFGTVIWNNAGAKAIFPVVQVGGAGCDSEPIVGYDLTTDEQKILTTEFACEFTYGNATDVEGNPEPEWGPTFWTSDSTFTSTILGTDNVWKQIEGTF